MSDKENAEPEAIGSPEEAFPSVLACLGGEKNLKVLDAPAGHGPLTKLLIEHGHDVTAADILPDEFEAEGVDCQYCNLNEVLPFEDNTFDVVAMCNGIHRCTTVGRTISEFARVLKPGGRLIITLRNYGRINRRVRFFFTGIVSTTQIRSGRFVENPEMHFRQELFLPQILTATTTAKLDVHNFEPVNMKKYVLAWLPLWLPIKLYTLFMSSSRRKKYFVDYTSSFVGLFSHFYLLELRKPKD